MQSEDSQGITGNNNPTPQDVASGFSGAIFARRMRAVREESGMTQQQVADLMARSGGKIHRSTVGKMENGDRPVTIDEAVQVAAILGVPLAELVTEPGSDTEAGRRHAERVQAQIRFRYLMHEWNSRIRQQFEMMDLVDLTERKLEDAWKQLREVGGEMPIVPVWRDDGTVVSASLFDELPTVLQRRLSGDGAYDQ